MQSNTQLNPLLGVRYPILLAPMDIISNARLTAAVSIAGGFGILGGGYGDRDWLEREIKNLTQLLDSDIWHFGIHHLEPRQATGTLRFGAWGQTARDYAFVW